MDSSIAIPTNIIDRNILISVIIGFAYQIYSVCGATIFQEIIGDGLGGALEETLGGALAGNGSGNAIKDLLKSFDFKAHGKFLLIPVVCIKVGIAVFYMYKFYKKKFGNKTNPVEPPTELSVRQAADNQNTANVTDNQNGG